MYSIRQLTLSDTSEILDRFGIVSVEKPSPIIVTFVVRLDGPVFPLKTTIFFRLYPDAEGRVRILLAVSIGKNIVRLASRCNSCRLRQ